VLEPSDSGLTFEGLIDALLVLYEECNADKLKKEREKDLLLLCFSFVFWSFNLKHSPVLVVT
jgi:hypothetical protein